MTRERLYIETMQQVFSSTSKVLIDARGNGNLLFLPLDKLMKATAASAPAAEPAAPAPAPQVAAPAPQPPAFDPRSRDLMRSRERGER